MVDKTHILEILRASYGNFDTKLECQYSETIVDEIANNKVSTVREWLTYHQVIIELKKTSDTLKEAKELQYRISDGEYPKTVCLDVLSSLKSTNAELVRLYEKIQNF